MRAAFLLVLMLLFAVLNESDALGEFRVKLRWRRVRHYSKRAATKWATQKGITYALTAKKRDILEIDTNMDDILDKEERQTLNIDKTLTIFRNLLAKMVTLEEP